jgi:hypothetical protein
MPIKPHQATIFAYQVGFGDCFLVRFTYAAAVKHILIDFGTTGLPADVASDQMLVIANDVARKCSGKLDAIVATHRHQDHISGFARNAKGTASGDVIRSLSPDVVVQPWTEEPDLAKDAKGPRSERKDARGVAKALGNMHMISQNVVSMLERQPSTFSAGLAAQVRFIGEDNISNKSAVENLATMAATRAYVFHGSPSGLEGVLPGVKTHVLGPPTVEQSSAITKQRARDPDEFWQLQLKRVADDVGSVDESTSPFPRDVEAPGGKLPMSSRWLARRMRDARGDQLLQIVRSLDKQMNNTSVILLFEAGNKKLLFPGDAQIENWQFALSKPKFQKLLASVDVYKVGHHGSLNATPKALWNMFDKRGPASKSGRMKSVLSTMPGKHGAASSHTEVPRSTLLKELASKTDLHSTHKMAHSDLCEEIRISLQ